jgi:hypothetical protein
MRKTKDATRKRSTHFEQVPLDVVKKIAEEDVPGSNKTATDEASADPKPTKTTAQSVPERTPHRNRR